MKIRYKLAVLALAASASGPIVVDSASAAEPSPKIVTLATPVVKAPSIELSWTVNDEDQIGGFEVAYRESGKAWTVKPVSAAARSYVVPGVAGRSYDVKVTPNILPAEINNITIPGEVPSEVPTLRFENGVLYWNAIPGATEYTIATVHNPTTTRNTTYVRVKGTSFAPPPFPGETVNYGIHVAEPPSKAPWAKEVAVTWPPVEKEKPPGTMLVALNQSGWGPTEWADTAPVVKYIRMGSGKVNEGEVDAMAKVHQRFGTVIFGEGGSTSGNLSGLANYYGLIKEFFRKYGVGGSFWAGREDLGAQYFELENEPGGNWFWSDSTNYQAYVSLMKAVHEKLAADFPTNTPQLLASYDGGKADSNHYGQEWKRLGGLPYADGVTVHPYGGATGSYGGANGNRAKTEQAHSETGKPVFVTELGWPTAVGKPATGDSQQWTEEQQAANIKNFIVWARERLYIGEVVIFGYRDYGTNNFYGVESHEGRKKQSYYALGEVSG